MQRAHKQSLGPVTEEIADIHEDRGLRVLLCPGGIHGHGNPRAFCRRYTLRRLDLETGLSGSLEEERDAAIIGVGAGSGRLGRGRAGARGRVVEETKNRAGGSPRMATREPARRVNLLDVNPEQSWDNHDIVRQS